MDFYGLLDDPDAIRHCYIRASKLKQLCENPVVLTALLKQLDVPGKTATLKKLSPGEMLEAIGQQIEHFRASRTSVWHGVPAAEVFAASIFRSGLPRKVLFEIFHDVRREAELAAPVREWLSGRGLTVYAEVPMGTKRIDVMGHRPEGFFRGHRLVGVELKNEIGQLKRGLDQMTTFAEHCHVVYLACTPAMAAEYLDAHAEARGVRHWDASVLNRKLEQFGFGLLLVEADGVHEILEPSERRVSDSKLEEVLAQLG